MPIYSYKGVTPKLGKNVYVAPNATIIGDVVIGDDSSIWFGVVIRGDVFPIRIGARTNIQDNAVVHVTTDQAKTSIGDDVTVGHLALIHGCSIGDRCLVGMGSIVLDNAIVEDDSFIAAGSVVPPRMHVPSLSLVVGNPAKIRRKLTEADLAAIKGASESYVDNARIFASDVRLVGDSG